MKWVLVLEHLLLEDPSFFDNFHSSSKYNGGGAVALSMLLLHLGTAEAIEKTEQRKIAVFLRFCFVLVFSRVHPIVFMYFTWTIFSIVEVYTTNLVTLVNLNN